MGRRGVNPSICLLLSRVLVTTRVLFFLLEFVCVMSETAANTQSYFICEDLFSTSSSDIKIRTFITPEEHKSVGNNKRKQWENLCGEKHKCPVVSKSSTVSALRPYLQAAVGSAELMGPAQPLVSAVKLRQKKCVEKGGQVDREREGRRCQTVVSPGARGTGEWMR